MSGRITESQLIIPALECMCEMPEGRITTKELIHRLELIFEPDGEDIEILDGRSDTRFSQKVRNLKSHKTLDKMGLAREIPDGFEITEAGRELVAAKH